MLTQALNNPLTNAFFSDIIITDKTAADAADVKEDHMKNLKAGIAVFAALLAALILTLAGCNTSPQESPETTAPEITETETETETEILFVTVFNSSFPADAKEITLDKDEIESFDTLLSALDVFPSLDLIDLCGFELSLDEKQRLSERFPGAKIKCRTYITLFDKKIYTDEAEIDLSGVPEIDTEELKTALSSLPAAVRVFSDTRMPAKDKESLKAEFSGIAFDIPGFVEICGIPIEDETTELGLNGEKIDAAELSEALKYLPLLQTVSLLDTGLDEDGQYALATEFPGVKFLWQVNILGDLYGPDTTDLDLSNKKELTADIMRRKLRLMPWLTRVDLSDISATNEELGALREEFPNVKIVWMLHMLRWYLKTDAIAYSDLIRDYDYQRLTDEDIQCLKYCTDLQALDLGHQAITDISVICDYLPELRILILADNQVKDLSPVVKLKHLHYIELFVNPGLTDVSPLGECKELVDVNISYLDINDISALLDLPLIERFWIEHTYVPQEQIQQLRDNHPDATIINKGSGSVDQGWRTHPRYYAMKEMFYDQYFISEEFSKYDQ